MTDSRTEVFQIRLTKEDKNQLFDIAKNAGLPTADLIRLSVSVIRDYLPLVQDDVKKRVHEALKESSKRKRRRFDFGSLRKIYEDELERRLNRALFDEIKSNAKE